MPLNCKQFYFSTIDLFNRSLRVKDPSQTDKGLETFSLPCRHDQHYNATKKFDITTRHRLQMLPLIEVPLWSLPVAYYLGRIKWVLGGIQLTLQSKEKSVALQRHLTFIRHISNLYNSLSRLDYSVHSWIQLTAVQRKSKYKELSFGKE